MNILVTGASGKVGKYVARRLVRAGHAVCNLDRLPPPEDFADVEWVQGDILDHAAMQELVKGYDAVAHLAGIPIPLFHPAEEVFRTNVMGTYNVAEAAAANRIRRFVYMSSESTLGFAFMERHQDPFFLPIDETHPLRPQDAYGMSKVAAEEVCQAVMRRTGMETVILRPPWIWVPEPEDVAMYRELVAEPQNWFRQLWSFCGVEDVASAVELALTREISAPLDSIRPARTYFIAAEENWTGRGTLALLSAHYAVPDTTAHRLDGACSVLSSRKFREDTGWTPQQTAADYV